MRPGRAACLVVVAAAVPLGVHSGKLGAAGREISRAQRAFVNALTEPSLADAARSLDRYHTVAGTYAGADVGGGITLRLRWAFETSFCLESAGGDGVQHLVGPGGSPAPGPCP